MVALRRDFKIIESEFAAGDKKFLYFSSVPNSHLIAYLLIISNQIQK